MGQFWGVFAQKTKTRILVELILPSLVFMLLQLHAKDQKTSIIWFSIKHKKFHFGPLLTSKKKKKKNLKNHLIQFYVFMLLNLHAKKSKTLRPLILDKNWTLHFGPISDPFWPQTAKLIFQERHFSFHETWNTSFWAHFSPFWP